MKNLHVVPRKENRWAVIKEGNLRASKTMDSKRKARRYGKMRAKNNNSCLFTHGRNAVIKDVTCFK